MDQMSNPWSFTRYEENEQSEAQRKVDEAWHAYEQCVAQGAKEEITQMKYLVFIMRSQMAQISEMVEGTKEMFDAIGDIATEVDSLFEMDFYPQAARFSIGIEKYPSFLQEFIKKRRAKRYFRKRMREMMGKVKIAAMSVSSASLMAQGAVTVMSSAISSITKSVSFTGGKKRGKKGAFALSPELAADIERRKASSPVFGGGSDDGSKGGASGGAPAGGAGAASSGSMGGGSVSGTSDGNVGSGSASTGDHWDGVDI